MASKIGQVTGQEVKTYKGVDNIRVLQVSLFGANPESVVYMNTSGEDTAPVNGDMVIVRELGDDKYTFGVRDPIQLAASPGEKMFYSRDSAGAIKSSIYLKDDGSIDINAPAGVNITGALTVSGIIQGLVDIIADYAETAITMLTHYHFGNLGRNTSTGVVTGGSAQPATPASTNSGGDIIDGSGTNLSLHTHSQGNDNGGDTEQDTSGPL